MHSAVDVPPWQPVAGPHHPLRRTPPRRPGSVRRTTTVDLPLPQGPPSDPWSGTAAVVVAGRDLRTPLDGPPVVLDTVDLAIQAELASGRVLVVDGGDAATASTLADALVGGTLRGGFSRHLAARLPDEAERRTLRFSALDDLGGAFLVGGYSMLRTGMLDDDPASGPDRAALQADVCVGWASGGPVHTVLAERGTSAVPYGPDAPPLAADDPEGWHPTADLATHTVRRARQLDVWRDERGALAVQSHLRDHYRAGPDAGDHDMVMHEYLVHATVDAQGRLRGLVAEARVLPWSACPGAVDAAADLEGVHLGDLATRARAALGGVAGCTHLASTMRALLDVRALAPLVG